MQNQVGQMTPAEFEKFVTYVQNLDEDHKWVMARNLPDDILWSVIYEKYSEMKARDEYYKNAPRA